MEEGNIILIDVISSGNCRFLDMVMGEKMEKERFRRGLGEPKVAYEQVIERILG